MGVRQAINENKSIASGVVIGLLIVAVGVAVWFSFFSGERASERPGAKSFFTDDNGKTFYVDLASNLPPYTHNGKTAYGCTVFTSDHGKTKFVGWLMRFTDEGKRRYEQIRQSKGNVMGESPFECVEVKKPGAPDDQWVKATLPAGVQIQRPPKVGGGIAEPVAPE